MKVPIWLRWSAVAMSAFLAGFYVAYASGYMKQSSERYMSSSKSRALDDAFRQGLTQQEEAAPSDATEPEVMFSSSKYAPVFVPEKHQTPPPPPQSWMHSSKSAPISLPPNTVVIPAPEGKQFFSGSKSSTIFSDQAPSSFPPPVNTSKSAPPAKGNYKGKGAP